MEYTIAKLASLSGVTTRTLRYYEQLGLLRPRRVSSNGYRIYGRQEVDTLQQILFYRELGVELKDIAVILNDPKYDRERALESHLAALLQKKDQLETLIGNVSRTIAAMKGETTMHDKEKFEGFQEKLIADNEVKYGKEVREKYGDEAVNASNTKLRGMSREKMQLAQEFSEAINQKLAEAFALGDPAGEKAWEVCDLHRQWLCLFWPEGLYSKEAHAALSDTYVEDERFQAYYDKIAPGCAEFLRDAIHIYCK